MTAFPQPARSPKTPAPGAKPKKGLSKVLVAVLCSAVFLILLGAAGACVYLNVGGVTPRVITALMALDPDYARLQSALEKRQQALDAAEEKLAGDQTTLNRQAASQVKAAQELKKAQDQLAQDKKDFEAQKNAPAATAKGAGLADIYNTMESASAAAILSKATTAREAADILSLLDSQKAAEILAAMDPKKAYEITLLLRP